MTRKFLEDLGLEKDTIDKILDENSADIGKEIGKTNAVKKDLAAANGELETVRGQLKELQDASGNAGDLQKKLDDLQAKYDADTIALQNQLTDRDYSDAIQKTISSKELKFTSKAAERDFIAYIRDKKPELKDGELQGVDELIKARKEAEPDAFASNKPTPKFAAPIGKGGTPDEAVPENVAQAKAIGSARKSNAQSFNDVLKNYL